MRGSHVLVAALLAAPALGAQSTAAGNRIPVSVTLAGVSGAQVQVRALNEETNTVVERSLPLGVTRTMLLTRGLTTFSTDTVVVKDSVLGSVAFAPRETQQITVGETKAVTIQYAPVSGAIEVVITGGPADFGVGLVLRHQVSEESITVGREDQRTVLMGRAGHQMQSNGIPLRQTMLKPGTWTVELDSGYATGWCANPARSTAAVRAGTVVRINVRLSRAGQNAQCGM